MRGEKIVITGMGVITPLGDTPEILYENLIAGRSAISWLKSVDTSRVACKIGGDLGLYNNFKKLNKYRSVLSGSQFDYLSSFVDRAPFSVIIPVFAALDAYIDAGLIGSDYYTGEDTCFYLGGHNFHNKAIDDTIYTFLKSPEQINPESQNFLSDFASVSLINNILGIKGQAHTVGGACASSGIAMKKGMIDILSGESTVALVGGGILSFSDLGYKALELMSAIAYKSFNDSPESASRPFDKRREGFVPSHGTGMIVLEKLSSALDRGAKIYAELVGVEYNNDGTHFSLPSKRGQVFVLNKLLNNNNIKPENIDYINAHATSTPLGDNIEVASIKEVFGDHAYRLKVNATKSMLGHTCWSSHVIELIVSILQMNNSTLHPTINIEAVDDDIDIDICKNIASRHNIDYFIKNSFGFGGINCCSLIKKYD